MHDHFQSPTTGLLAELGVIYENNHLCFAIDTSIICTLLGFANHSYLLLCHLLLYFYEYFFLTQTEDAEIGHGDDVNDEEDIPPVYEAVVNKFPSYEYLCGNRNYMTLGEKNEGPRHQKQETHTDNDLPTYAEATEMH